MAAVALALPATLVAGILAAAGAAAAQGPAPAGRTARVVHVDRGPLALAYDRARKTVRFTLIPSDTKANYGMNFDGYDKGALTVRVPKGWTVTVTCHNRGTLNHTCAIVGGASASGALFRHASSPSPTTGLNPGESVTFTFVASRVGSFRLACLVPGHEAAGMWDHFVVTRRGVPSARPSGA